MEFCFIFRTFAENFEIFKPQTIPSSEPVVFKVTSF